MITASGLGLYQAQTSENTSFVIDTLGHKSNEFDVIITGPATAIPPYEAIPLRCYQQKDGKLLAEFTTLATGNHKIEVFINGEHIRGSPFECQSFSADEVYLLDYVPPIESPHCNPGTPIQFKVDRAKAGIADLDVIVTSPVGEALPIEVKGLNDQVGIDLIEFRPDVAGTYKFVIRYGGVQVPESPVTFSVKEREPEPPAGTTDIRAFGQGLQKGVVSQTIFSSIQTLWYIIFPFEISG